MLYAPAALGVQGAPTNIKVLLEKARVALDLDESAYFSVEPIVDFAIRSGDNSGDDHPRAAIEASAKCVHDLFPEPHRRAEALFSLLSCLVYTSEEGYDAVMRSTFLKAAIVLGFSSSWFYREESYLAARLMSDFRSCLRNAKKPLSGKSSSEESQDGTLWERIRKNWKRSALVGGAAVVGGAVVGLTGGLAAPAVAHGLVVVGGAVGVGAALAGTAAFLTSTAGVAVLAGIFTATGAGLAGFKMHRRVKSISEFGFRKLRITSHCSSALGITVCVSGWLVPEEESRGGSMRNWRNWRSTFEDGAPLSPSDEFFELVFETKELLQLGSAMNTMIAKEALKEVGVEALKQTAMQSLIAAVAWPATLLKSFEIIDNSWSVAIGRADKAGIILAETLASRSQGNRPVSLIGYSIGARVVYTCLLTLAQMARTGKYNDADGNAASSTAFKSVASIVQSAILISAPVPNDRHSWESIRSVVSGRLVNGYCQQDWLWGSCTALLCSHHRAPEWSRCPRGASKMSTFQSDVQTLQATSSFVKIWARSLQAFKELLQGEMQTTQKRKNKNTLFQLQYRRFFLYSIEIRKFCENIYRRYDSTLFVFCKAILERG